MGIREKRNFEKSNDYFLCSIIIVLPTIYIIANVLNENQGLKDKLTRLLIAFGMNEKYILNNVCSQADFLGNAVWTLTTILAAFMVLHYSSIGNNTYGVKNRKIISYTCGTFFIPEILIFNIAVVLCMTFAYYVKSFATFFLLAIYSILLQLLLIFGSIFLTSQRVCFRVILHVEEKQFHELCEVVRNNKVLFHKLGVISNKENAFVYHSDMILKGQDSLTEKFEIIQNILYIPFNIEYQKFFLYVDGIYYYLYQNMRVVVSYIGEHVNERQKLYTTFYENVNDAWKKYKTIDQPKEREIQKIIILIYLGAFFHIVIPEKRLDERWECFNFAIEIFDEESFQRIIIAEILMSLYDLWRKELISFKNKAENAKIEKFLKLLSTKKEGYSINSMKASIPAIKEQLQLIVLSWNVFTTMEKRFQYETAIEILECMDDNEKDDYIHYLLRHAWGGSTYDKIISI